MNYNIVSVSLMFCLLPFYGYGNPFDNTPQRVQVYEVGKTGIPVGLEEISQKYIKAYQERNLDNLLKMTKQDPDRYAKHLKRSWAQEDELSAEKISYEITSLVRYPQTPLFCRVLFTITCKISDDEFRRFSFSVYFEQDKDGSWVVAY